MPLLVSSGAVPGSAQGLTPHGLQDAFADRVLRIVDEYCPGFSRSVIARCERAASCFFLSPLLSRSLLLRLLTHPSTQPHARTHRSPRDVLSPLDLERIFALHRGSISHGALALHQLGYARPAPGFSSHRSPLAGLYLCGAGAHPGGGVMGAAGRNCARVVLWDVQRRRRGA